MAPRKRDVPRVQPLLVESLTFIREMAAGGPPMCPEYGWDESAGPCSWQCCYCDTEAPTDVELDDPLRHQEACLWRRACALKEQQEEWLNRDAVAAGAVRNEEQDATPQA